LAFAFHKGHFAVNFTGDFLVFVFDVTPICGIVVSSFSPSLRLARVSVSIIFAD